jgi:hypothetical protein
MSYSSLYYTSTQEITSIKLNAMQMKCKRVPTHKGRPMQITENRNYGKNQHENFSARMGTLRK